MFTFLLIVQTLVAASLVAVILMQRSEGGGLGVGGSSSGFMTARGAADFLTRATAVLGGLFIFLSILLAAIAGATSAPTTVDTSLVKQQTAPSGPAPAFGVRPVPPAETGGVPNNAQTAAGQLPATNGTVPVQ
ncbi:MAG: preprotein translocase subunit SecG [Sphingomicrobium sp.]